LVTLVWAWDWVDVRVRIGENIHLFFLSLIVDLYDGRSYRCSQSSQCLVGPSRRTEGEV
jgi:hypothetical protein